jgi:hypothetical protein
VDFLKAFAKELLNARKHPPFLNDLLDLARRLEGLSFLVHARPIGNVTAAGFLPPPCIMCSDAVRDQQRGLKELGFDLVKRHLANTDDIPFRLRHRWRRWPDLFESLSRLPHTVSLVSQYLKQAWRSIEGAIGGHEGIGYILGIIPNLNIESIKNL